MKRIFYASGSVLTGDRMAETIVKYAGALASRELSDTVDIPISLGDGTAARAQLLIGPASQLVVIPEPNEQDVPEDETTIEELEKKVRQLSSPHPHPADGDLTSAYPEGDEFGE